MRVLVTKLVFPGGQELELDPPFEWEQGEPIPLTLRMGQHKVAELIRMEWQEIEEEDERQALCES